MVGEKLEIENAEYFLNLTAALGIWHGHSDCQTFTRTKDKSERLSGVVWHFYQSFKRKHLNSWM